VLQLLKIKALAARLITTNSFFIKKLIDLINTNSMPYIYGTAEL
jgi:hypothetical protein